MANGDALLQAVLGIGQNRPAFDLLSGVQVGANLAQRNRALGLEERDVRIRERRFEDERVLLEEEVLGRKLERRANEERLRQLESSGKYEELLRDIDLPVHTEEAKLKKRTAESKLERFDVDQEWEALLRDLDADAKRAEIDRSRASAEESRADAALKRLQGRAAENAPLVQAARFGDAMGVKLDSDERLRLGRMIERQVPPTGAHGEYTTGDMNKVQRFSRFSGDLLDRVKSRSQPTAGVEWNDLGTAATNYLGFLRGMVGPKEGKAARSVLERIAESFEEAPPMMAILGSIESAEAADMVGLAGQHGLPKGSTAELLTDPDFLELLIERMADADLVPQPVNARVPGAASRPAAADFEGRGWAK